MQPKRLFTAIALATIGATTPLSAQRWRTIEVGAFGQYTMFGDVLHLDNALGLGGMVGFFVLPNVVAEGDISISRTDGPLSGKLTYRPIHARLAYHVPLSDQLKLALGVANAALAVGLLAALRLPRYWTPRLLAAGGVNIALAIATPLALVILFGNQVGATFAEVFWLLLAEGLFLTSVLAPLEAVRESRARSEVGTKGTPC